MAYRQLGNYQVVSHLETPECSLRLLKLTKDSVVHPHHHHKTTQTYFVLEGTAEVTAAEETMVLKPHQVLRVPIDTVHSIRAQGEVLVLSISIPPLEASDQHVATQR